MNANDIRIFFIGDSYVQGTGDPECLGWAGQLCVGARHAGHNFTGHNLGVRRETSSDIARRWLAECAPRLPAMTENHVVFSFGANDVALENGVRRVPEDDTLANLHAILGAATARRRCRTTRTIRAWRGCRNAWVRLRHRRACHTSRCSR